MSRLSYRQACKLLGANGDTLIRQGGAYDIDIDTQVTLNEKQFCLQLYNKTCVRIHLNDLYPARLSWECSCKQKRCEHVGASFSLILEEKTALGLAKAPQEPSPVTPLSDSELVQLALEERQQRANKEKMRVTSQDPNTLWTDYAISNPLSGKSYRVALRGRERGDSYCTCPDFRKNSLGTCKHILHVLKKVKRKFSKAQKQAIYQPQQLAVHLLYAETLELRLLLPKKLPDPVKKILKPLTGKAINNAHDLLKRIQQVERLGQSILIYPDAEECIQRRLFQERISASIDQIRSDPAKHPLRETLLKAPLLPYQLDGIAFAVGAGRAILADDMGLGKTIQGIGVAELLAREAGISRVLIAAPASLKSQWREEIHKFCDRSVQIVLGSASERMTQYRQDTFFTLCNYEQVIRDISHISDGEWDLIILDEGQRIKNWEAKTSQAIKSLSSRFALVLSGTPLENRLDDLFSVVEFIDDRRLGPAFRFFNKHRIVDENGKVIGYKNLAEIRKHLSPVLLRRTRGSVMKELPPRTTEIIRITASAEQQELHDAQRLVISAILNKKYISEMDLLRLQKALLLSRMAADSSYLITKEPPGYSTKLEELQNLLTALSAEPDRKIVLFSEWTTMLDLIEPQLESLSMDYVRLDGSVPQKQRQQLVHRFQTEATCRVFMTSNAGSTGLNLQAANTIINVDLPWNPAVLEQRIARAHRMGQKRAVQVYLLVTENTIEESMLGTLSSKHQLALAALDPDTDIDQVDLSSGIEELKQRLEILLGAKPEAPIEQSNKEEIEQQLDRQQRIAAAGGQMLTASFQFLNELLPEPVDPERNEQLSNTIRQNLESCTEPNAQGEIRLTLNFKDKNALDKLAQNMASMLALSEDHENVSHK